MRSSFKGTITVGARGSALSQAQVQEVAQELHRFHPDVHLEPFFVSTWGDNDLSISLRHQDKTDIFTREIDLLQLQGKCRIAIHSAKDLPDPLPPGLTLVALTKGVDPADSLVMKENHTLESLPSGARIGVSSLRRESALKKLREDFQFVDIRGTIERRLSLLNSEIDAVVMAEAALIRLHLTHLNRLRLEGSTAPLQGKLAIVARTDDEEMLELFSSLDTRKTVLYLGLDPSSFVTVGKLIHYPVIRVEPRPFNSEIAQALQELPYFTHLLFTSKNSVRIFLNHLENPSLLSGKKIFAIGKMTGAALLNQGITPYRVAEEETQEGLIALLQEEDLKGAYLFLPQSSLSRPLLREYLQSQKEPGGYHFFSCTLYDTLFQRQEPIADWDRIDEVVFTSPSTVENFFKIYSSFPKGKRILTQGKITETALRMYLRDCAQNEKERS